METVSGGEPASKEPCPCGMRHQWHQVEESRQGFELSEPEDTKESKVDEKEKGPTSATTDEKPKFQMSASAKAFKPGPQTRRRALSINSCHVGREHRS